MECSHGLTKCKFKTLNIWLKYFLIRNYIGFFYPWTWNSTTGIAIMISSTILLCDEHLIVTALLFLLISGKNEAFRNVSPFSVSDWPEGESGSTSISGLKSFCWNSANLVLFLVLFWPLGVAVVVVVVVVVGEVIFEGKIVRVDGKSSLLSVVLAWIHWKWK